MSLRILIFGDGENELGKIETEYAPSDDLPALPRLIHRVLGEPAQTTYTTKKFKKIKAAHGRGGKWAKKTKRAIEDARKGGYQGTVILIDRDRKSSAERLGPLTDARDAMLACCAVGNAVETFDAWMIADGKAVREATGKATQSQSHPKPEKLNKDEGTGNHPKDWATRIFGGTSSLTPAYAVVALHADIDLLKRTCPKGFAPFAKDIEKRIAPLVGS
ncbi:MAG TPA: hypothetical protein ENH84_07280 [Phycisphaerae bacterium]|nr:hypothetical protein [Phycisphaerae bacterium]